VEPEAGVIHAAALRVVPREFYARETETVARELLGMWLLRASPDGFSGGPIVETEAYAGPGDSASHARAGRTKRTAAMFGEVGHAYAYLVYGMHECLNVVTYSGREAGAVLLRAIEPRVGIDLMRARRGRLHDPDAKLAAGPARLCQALAVTREFDGHDLTTRDRLWLAMPVAGPGATEVSVGPRIGVDYATEDWRDRPWRFWIAGNPSVSR